MGEPIKKLFLWILIKVRHLNLNLTRFSNIKQFLNQLKSLELTI